ncbi:MAG: iron ABC transporter permease [Phycisphaerae bacterium]|nr:iron ABC transporter permease [Saprospiraceae bacterium]
MAKKQTALQVFLLIVLFLSIGMAMMLGRYTISFEKLYHAIWVRLFHPELAVNSVEYSVIFQLRLPRILLAALSGMALSVSGAVLQGIFRNPLVGPSMIGVSSGAAFGAVSAIFMALSGIAVMACSFVGGLLSLLFTMSIAGKVGSKNILAIILGGIVTGALFSALVSLVTFVADPRDTLPVIVYWLMGSFNGADASKVLLLGAVCLVCFSIIFKSRYVINLLALGDEEAYALGVDVVKLRILFLALTTLVTAATVSVSGTIGWVGLVVPHIARMITGSDYRSLVVTSGLIGGIYLVVADTLVRISPFGEVPIGILSALVGAPVLAYLLHTRKVSNA